MKNIKIILTAVITLFLGKYSQAQIQVNSLPTDGISLSNVLLDGSTTYSSPDYIGKGIVVPSVDLVNFEFNLIYADGITFPTYFDGMIVYNNLAGTTLTAGDRSSVATVVVPGFYYFSNPDGATNYNVTGGQWLPVGGPSATIKTKTVASVIVGANPTTATLDLGTGTIAASEVTSFLGAKIYNASGDLVMTADAAYDKVTNVLTTGNGMLYSVLPAGTYSVVVDYR
jgi:hypothetical protein